MRDKSDGFTLIELVVVIVILGILAVTALPKFVDLRSDANEAAFQGVRGAAASAMSTNYAGCSAAGQVAAQNKCVKISDCNEVGNIMQGGLPANYTVASAVMSATNGATTTCTLANSTFSVTGAATFTGIATVQP